MFRIPNSHQSCCIPWAVHHRSDPDKAVITDNHRVFCCPDLNDLFLLKGRNNSSLPVSLFLPRVFVGWPHWITWRVLIEKKTHPPQKKMGIFVWPMLILFVQPKQKITKTEKCTLAIDLRQTQRKHCIKSFTSSKVSKFHPSRPSSLATRNSFKSFKTSSDFLYN